MKIKKITAVLLAMLMIFASCAFAASADNGEETASEHKEGEITFIFSDDTPEIVKNSIIAWHTGDDQGIATYNVLCTLLGHKEEDYYYSIIIHKVNATAPRCLKKQYKAVHCSRCEETLSAQLLSSEYIYCCP